MASTRIVNGEPGEVARTSTPEATDAARPLRALESTGTIELETRPTDLQAAAPPLPREDGPVAMPTRERRREATPDRSVASAAAQARTSAPSAAKVVAAAAVPPAKALRRQTNPEARPRTRPASSDAVVTNPAGASPAATYRRANARLYVDSRPVGATVLLDGRPIGTTPLEVSDVSAGDHAVGLELSGYRSWATSIRIVAGERSRVAASLER